LHSVAVAGSAQLDRNAWLAHTPATPKLQIALVPLFDKMHFVAFSATAGLRTRVMTWHSSTVSSKLSQCGADGRRIFVQSAGVPVAFAAVHAFGGSGGCASADGDGGRNASGGPADADGAAEGGASGVAGAVLGITIATSGVAGGCALHAIAAVSDKNVARSIRMHRTLPPNRRAC